MSSIRLDIGPIKELLDRSRRPILIHVGSIGAAAAVAGVRDGNKTVAEIARRQEFGFITRHPSTGLLVTVPPRSFIRSAIYSMDAQAIVQSVAADFIRLKGYGLLVERLGNAVRALVRQQFLTAGLGQWRPLRPFTIEQRRRRGNFSVRPLIDTGQLLRSIDWREVKP